MKSEFGQLNQEISGLDVSGATSEPSSINRPKAEEVMEEERNSKTGPSSPYEQTECENTSIDIPHQSSSNESVLNLKLEPSMKRLPHHYNRGIPKTTYEPQLSSKVRYPTSNYASNHHCLNQISHF